EQQALLKERLAAIGQTVTGLAHESRNALQRCQACLERLSWKLQQQPEALDLVHRAQHANDDLVRLFNDVRQYAAPIQLDCSHCDVAAIWRRVWGQALGRQPGRDASLVEQ